MPEGKRWLARLDLSIREGMTDGGLNNKTLASCLGISERHLIRRVKQLTGLSPQQYIRQHRLQQAMEYLEQGTYRTVKETAAAVGYANAGYFISQFEHQFGKRPLDVLREWGWR
ncbi:MAG: AraC family transcriptional regulator [Phaeodactylibacter sp.]|nr:AraC family transcriptional regulator [Phaeodactylibacter sp.]